MSEGCGTYKHTPNRAGQQQGREVLESETNAVLKGIDMIVYNM